MLQKLYRWYGKKMVWGFAALACLLVIAGIAFNATQDKEVESDDLLPTVRVSAAGQLTATEGLNFLGTVRAVSQAEIKSESAGRITRVPVELGQTVQAGSIVAVIDNARESAAVLQAEGVYEAAIAAASVSEVSVSQAELALDSTRTNTISALQNAYTTVNNVLYTTVDQYYSDPTSPLTSPKLSNGNRTYLRQERVAFEKDFPAWQQEIGSATTDTDLTALINESRNNVARLRAIVDSFLTSLQTRKTETFDGVDVSTRIAELNSVRATLEGTVTTLDNSESALKQANESLVQARLGAANDEVSAASAQIKQALGALRAAQANLSKTIMRSPIAGTIDELDVNVGDFVTTYASVAKVANNNAQEISIFVGENDLQLFTVGDSVLIENEITGIVTTIGTGIDVDTKKTEIKIATESSELTSGDTVTVTLVRDTESTESVGPLRIPIAAIRFTADTGSVFMVEDGKIVSKEVKVGAVRGSLVEIEEGLSSSDIIITDVRGLIEGSRVEALN